MTYDHDTHEQVPCQEPRALPSYCLAAGQRVKTGYYSTCTDLSSLVTVYLYEPPGDPPGDQGVHNTYMK